MASEQESIPCHALFVAEPLASILLILESAHGHPENHRFSKMLAGQAFGFISVALDDGIEDQLVLNQGLLLSGRDGQGGLLGRKVQLVYYDDQQSTATAVQLYQKLITSDKVDLLVGPYQSDLDKAIAPLVTRSKLAMPMMDANVEEFSGKYPYLIQSITQTPRYMIPVIDMAAQKGVSVAKQNGDIW